MTELEKITYARTFIDKLANGIDPTDGSYVPDGEVVNNVRVSRCLFYVSDILRQVIDNGGIIPPPQISEKKAKKQPYTLSAEQVERFEYSDTPITATEIFNRIMAVGPTERVKKFPKRNLTRWLVSLDLLEEIAVNGTKMKRPTSAGEDMGILLEERLGQYGSYYVTLYNTDAQHFILDNIEAVIAFDNEIYKDKMNLGNQGKAWDREQDEKLIGSFKDGLTVSEIAAILKRGENAIRMRLKNKGIDPDTVIEVKPAETEKKIAEIRAEAEKKIAESRAEAEKKIDESHAEDDKKIAESRAAAKKIAESRAVAPSADAVAPEKTCRTCRFARSGECFPQKEICKDYEKAYDVPNNERADWPEMGDASYLRQKGKHR